MCGLNPSDHDLPQPATKSPSCTPVNEIQEFECKNSIQEMQKMAKVIKAFHDNLKCGPEYECTCCDQLWYQSLFCHASCVTHVSYVIMRIVFLTKHSGDFFGNL